MTAPSGGPNYVVNGKYVGTAAWVRPNGARKFHVYERHTSGVRSLCGRYGSSPFFTIERVLADPHAEPVRADDSMGSDTCLPCARRLGIAPATGQQEEPR